MTQETTVAYLYKSFGQDMLLKPSQKFLVAQSHFLRLATIFVVLVFECNLGFGNLEDTMCGNRYFVGVSSQIG